MSARFHHLAQRAGVFARFQRLGDAVGLLLQVGQQRGAGFQFAGVAHRAGQRCGLRQRGGQLAGKALADKAGGAAGDIDEFANQVAVDAGDKVIQRQINVFNLAAELGGDVIAHPFRVQPAVQIALRGDEGAARLGHFLAVHGQKPWANTPVGVR